MDLGVYANYPLPTSISTAFGAQTAQELADQWEHRGPSRRLSPGRRKRRMSHTARVTRVLPERS